MSAIVELQQRIQDTIARIAEYEKAAALPRAPQSLFFGIRSLEKLKTELERDFARIAKDEELEICKYRLLPQQGTRPAITAIANAWSGYQALFSAVYDALLNGPKARTSKRVEGQTQLGFAYTYSGSIGVVLTLPNRQLDYLTTRSLETAMQTIFEMAKSHNPEGLAAFKERLGIGPLSKLHHWTNAHTSFHAGAAIEWEISTGAKPELLVQIQEFEALKAALANFTEPTTATESFTGKLIGASLRRRTFEMLLDDGELIGGTFVDAITEKHEAALPHRYEVLLQTTTRMNPAIEKIEQKHVLLQIIRDLASQ
jgi:hypothetical protein